MIVGNDNGMELFRAGLGRVRSSGHLQGRSLIGSGGSARVSSTASHTGCYPPPLINLSHTMYLLISFMKSTPTQNRQLSVYYY